MKSFIKVDQKQYELDKTKIRLYFNPEPCIDIFCDSNHLTKPGIAINCISLANTITSIEDIYNKQIVLCDNEKDNIANNQLNDLSESVICLPGKVLELRKLRLRFTHYENKLIHIELEALCWPNLKVYGEILASFEQ